MNSGVWAHEAQKLHALSATPIVCNSMHNLLPHQLAPQVRGCLMPFIHAVAAKVAPPPLMRFCRVVFCEAHNIGYKQMHDSQQNYRKNDEALIRQGRPYPYRLEAAKAMLQRVIKEANEYPAHFGNEAPVKYYRLPQDMRQPWEKKAMEEELIKAGLNPKRYLARMSAEVNLSDYSDSFSDDDDDLPLQSPPAAPAPAAARAPAPKAAAAAAAPKAAPKPTASAASTTPAAAASRAQATAAAAAAAPMPMPMPAPMPAPMPTGIDADEDVQIVDVPEVDAGMSEAMYDPSLMPLVMGSASTSSANLIGGGLDSGSMSSANLIGGDLDSGSMGIGSLFGGGGDLDSGDLLSGSMGIGNMGNGGLDIGGLTGGSMGAGNMASGDMGIGSVSSGGVSSGGVSSGGVSSGGMAQGLPSIGGCSGVQVPAAAPNRSAGTSQQSLGSGSNEYRDPMYGGHGYGSFGGGNEDDDDDDDEDDPDDLLGEKKYRREMRRMYGRDGDPQRFRGGDDDDYGSGL